MTPAMSAMFESKGLSLVGLVPGAQLRELQLALLVHLHVLHEIIDGYDAAAGLVDPGPAEGDAFLDFGGHDGGEPIDDRNALHDLPDLLVEGLGAPEEDELGGDLPEVGKDTLDGGLLEILALVEVVEQGVKLADLLGDVVRVVLEVGEGGDGPVDAKGGGVLHASLQELMGRWVEREEGIVEDHASPL